MIILVLVVLGLCLGSFANALVWRLKQQETKVSKKYSVLKGRSMCPNCQHELTAKDLLPVLSWFSLKGRCRYCRQPISWQYPLVELATAGLFVISYEYWPKALSGGQIFTFSLWLILLIGLMALFIYDLRWFTLPNRLIYPLSVIASVIAIYGVVTAPSVVSATLNLIGGVLVGGGIFYGLFQLSNGKWIGGGDVKLGSLLGIIVASPGRSLLFIFMACVLGTLATLPLILRGQLKRNSLIPFGPFLIVGAIVSVLFGVNIIDWYKHLFIG